MSLFWEKDDKKLWNDTKKMSKEELIDEITEVALTNFGESDIHAIANVLRMKEGLSFDLTNAQTKAELESSGHPMTGLIKAKA